MFKIVRITFDGDGFITDVLVRDLSADLADILIGAVDFLCRAHVAAGDLVTVRILAQ